MLKYAKLPGGCDVENFGSAGEKGKCLISVLQHAVTASLSGLRGLNFRVCFVGFFFFLSVSMASFAES